MPAFAVHRDPRDDVVFERRYWAIASYDANGENPEYRVHGVNGFLSDKMSKDEALRMANVLCYDDSHKYQIFQEAVMQATKNM